MLETKSDCTLEREPIIPARGKVNNVKTDPEINHLVGENFVLLDTGRKAVPKGIRYTLEFDANP